mgnify:CR=1 FL=1
MSKKVLILSGSPRKGGNSDILCDEFLRGAQDAGHKAEKIRVAEKRLFRSPKQLTIGIVDPMTSRDAVRFAMKAARKNGRTVLL